MERRALLVCLTVGFLGLLTAALGFAAEAKRVKANLEVQRVSGSSKRSSTVTDGALLKTEQTVKVKHVFTHCSVTCEIRVEDFYSFSIFQQSASFRVPKIMKNVVGRLESYGAKQEHPQLHKELSLSNRMLMSETNLVTFIIAFLLLLTGAALNDQHGEEQMYFGNYCFVVKAGVFAGGAVLSLASVSLGIIYYITLSSAKGIPTWGPNSSQGIAMGNAEVPTQSTQPIPMQWIGMQEVVCDSNVKGMCIARGGLSVSPEEKVQKIAYLVFDESPATFLDFWQSRCSFLDDTIPQNFNVRVGTRHSATRYPHFAPWIAFPPQEYFVGKENNNKE
ncbi:hypothetical protein ACLOJK_033780 [Asimina triloba]